VINSAERFTGILIHRGVLIAPRGVLIAPVQRDMTGYHQILSKLVYPVYRDEECGCKSVCGKETLLNKLGRRHWRK